MQDLSHNERIHTGQSTGLFVSFLLLINTSVVAEPPETRLDNDAVIQALRARNDRYRTGRFSWTEERFDAKGSYLHPDMHPRRNPEKKTLPAADQVLIFERSLTFDGVKTRHHFTGNVVDEMGQVHKQDCLVTFDGQSNRLFDTQRPGFDFPHGRLYPPEKGNQERKLLVLEPLLQSFRLMNPDMELLKIGNYEVADRLDIVEGSKCIRLMEQSSGAQSRDSYWFDPAQDYAIRRYVQYRADGSRSRQTDFQNIRHSEHGWIPQGWTIKKYDGDGRLITSYTATVNSYEINHAVPATDFTIDFPLGTYVDDLVAGANYIQRKNGSKRVVTKQENEASYEELLKTDSGAAAPRLEQSRVPQRWWLIGLNIFGIMLVLAYFYWRKTRKTSASP